VNVLFDFSILIFYVGLVDFAWTLIFVLLFKLNDSISEILNSDFKLFKFFHRSFVISFRFFYKFNCNLCIFVSFWRNTQLSDRMFTSILVQSLPAVTIWEYYYDLSVGFVLDEVSEFCIFVGTNVHTLTILVIICEFTEVETSVFPNSDPMSVFLAVLELSEVNFRICQKPLNDFVLGPFAYQLLLVSCKHAKP